MAGKHLWAAVLALSAFAGSLLLLPHASPPPEAAASPVMSRSDPAITSFLVYGAHASIDARIEALSDESNWVPRVGQLVRAIGRSARAKGSDLPAQVTSINLLVFPNRGDSKLLSADLPTALLRSGSDDGDAIASLGLLRNPGFGGPARASEARQSCISLGIRDRSPVFCGAADR